MALAVPTCQFANRDELLRTEQAEDLLGLAHGTLSVWRSARRYNLPYVKLGRSVRYRRSDLERFLADHTIGGAAE